MADDEKNEIQEPEAESESPEAPTAEQGDDHPPAADAEQGAEDASEAASQSDSPPPSEEASEAEEGEDHPPAADAERSTRAENDEPVSEKPKGEEKGKEAIPGADLEPIAVEPEEAPLSAEEQARREAEEEERRRREAELVGEAEEEEPAPAGRAPAKMESGARYLATGKRKQAIARVTLAPGNGEFEVNNRPLGEFFPRPLHQTMARQPLVTSGYEGSVDVRVRVHGGGISGQAGAVRHGIARALTEIDPELRGELKRRGFLTRDARVKERRKAGLKKARKRPQFSKR
jgi:small subunit ribosomal protein S9